MPNKANLRKWVEALRSGQYEQGRGNMRSLGKYCCLGVAIEVAIDNGVVCEPNWGSTSTVPDVVANWYGVTGRGGLNQRLRNEVGTLGYPADLNDSGFYTFDMIANGIEATYKLLED